MWTTCCYRLRSWMQISSWWFRRDARSIFVETNRLWVAWIWVQQVNSEIARFSENIQALRLASRWLASHHKAVRHDTQGSVRQIYLINTKTVLMIISKAHKNGFHFSFFTYCMIIFCIFFFVHTDVSAFPNNTLFGGYTWIFLSHLVYIASRWLNQIIIHSYFVFLFL